MLNIQFKAIFSRKTTWIPICIFAAVPSAQILVPQSNQFQYYGKSRFIYDWLWQQTREIRDLRALLSHKTLKIWLYNGYPRTYLPKNLPSKHLKKNIYIYITKNRAHKNTAAHAQNYYSNYMPTHIKHLHFFPTCIFPTCTIWWPGAYHVTTY